MFEHPCRRGPVLLVGINAKYIHTNLALRDLRAYALARGNFSVQLQEFTINQPLDQILEGIYRAEPALIAFSCYIWNLDLVQKLGDDLKQILPRVPIICGGPEVSFESVRFLQENPWADGVLSGEGEEAFFQLLRAVRGEQAYGEVPSLIWRRNGEIVENPLAEPLDLQEIPFPYGQGEDLSNRIVYYESSRGCPFRCRYCLSSLAGNVRLLPLERVYQDLDFFLKRQVRQVKFVDRTFNCNREHAMGIWRYLIEHDNGVTNFHFELAAHLLRPQELELLRTAREGLFQFEIGVQSTNASTIQAIDRTTDFQTIGRACRTIASFGNIHQHLDLIAGLPWEDFASFGRSFDDVYALGPEQLQLGFLKVLKGSGMYRDAARYGILYRHRPPYEVLQTHVLPYGDLLRLKEVEAMVELYYNSCRFSQGVEYLVSLWPRPFLFYLELGEFFLQRGYTPSSLTESRQYEGLRALAPERCAVVNLWELDCRLLFDLCRHRTPRKLPEGLQVPPMPPKDWVRAQFARPQVQAFYQDYGDLSQVQLERAVHCQVFPFDVQGIWEGQVLCFFHYRRRDLLGRAAVLTLPLGEDPVKCSTSKGKGVYHAHGIGTK